MAHHKDAIAQIIKGQWQYILANCNSYHVEKYAAIMTSK